jgi:hypothetical protein
LHIKVHFRPILDIWKTSSISTFIYDINFEKPQIESSFCIFKPNLDFHFEYKTWKNSTWTFNWNINFENLNNELWKTSIWIKLCSLCGSVWNKINNYNDNLSNNLYFHFWLDSWNLCFYIPSSSSGFSYSIPFCWNSIQYSLLFVQIIKTNKHSNLLHLQHLILIWKQKNRILL